MIEHPMFYPGAAFAGAVFLLIVLKFLIGSRSADVSESVEEAARSSSGGRKKKGKKQKAQEKKASDSPRLKKDSRNKNELKSYIETDQQIFEEGKNDKKKDSKSKVKSKKKKNSQVKVDSTSISKPEVYDHGVDTGEWKTVCTKEQREQQKREKLRKQEDVAGGVEAIIENPAPLVQPVYKPTPNISAIAKGIAPRFARAAGETWQEKPASTGASLPLHSKRPMPPATVPGTTKQSSKSSTVNQGWTPGNQGKSQWPGDVGTSWDYSTQTTASNDLIGMSWPPSDTTSSLLSIATSGDKDSVTGWTPGGSTWQTTGTTSSNNMTWDISTEDWVHVNNGQNGRNINTSTDTWVNNESTTRTRTVKKIEEWTLEPEGFPVHPPQPDPNDPWNIEVVGTTEEGGDWSAPASTWDNTNDEWKAPSPVKPAPTYVDVSSDDERISTKIISQSTAIQGHSASPQAIVGAGPELINQAASNAQGQSKKSRRRRKKKTGNNDQEPSSPQASTPEIETPKFETLEKQTSKKENEPKPEQTLKIAEQTLKIAEQALKIAPTQVKETVEQTKDDWTEPKTAKKRKSKARKAD